MGKREVRTHGHVGYGFRSDPGTIQTILSASTIFMQFNHKEGKGSWMDTEDMDSDPENEDIVFRILSLIFNCFLIEYFKTTFT